MNIEFSNKELDLVQRLIINGIQDVDDRLRKLRRYPEYWRDEDIQLQIRRDMIQLGIKLEHVRSGSDQE